MRFHFSIKNLIIEWHCSQVTAIFICALSFASTATSQQIAPGGVADPALWATARIDSGHCALVQNGNRAFIYQTSRSEPATINYNPAIVLNGQQEGLHIDMENDWAASSTYFIVLIPEDNIREYELWTLSALDSTMLIMTNQRVADVTGSRYFNYEQNGDPQARLYNYVRNIPDQITHQQLSFFKSDAPDIPVSAFKGKVSEIIVYDRTLSEGEKLRVQSYLAIKYGISLSQYGAPLYINSAGKVIWNGLKNTGFVHDVTGIWRDDRSGLNQFISTSAAAPGMLSIGFSPDIIQSGARDSAMTQGAFCIWSHDASPTNVSEVPALGINSIQRQWKVVTNDPESFRNTELIIDADFFEFGENYDAIWLKITEDAQGQSAPSLARYVHGVKKDGNIVFRHLTWDDDNSGSDFFTFSPAPKLFPSILIEQPTCDKMNSGKIHLAVIGGSRPYTITVTNQATGDYMAWIEDGKEASIHNIKTGKYRLYIEDASGNSYYELFDVSHEDGPSICLDKLYRIPQGQSVLLDASSDCGKFGSTYQWTMPDGGRISGSRIRLSEQGSYSIEVSKNGCLSIETISVLRPEPSLFANVKLSPNPVAPGQSVAVRAVLEKPAIIEMQIITVNGRLISQRILGESELINTQFNAPQSIGIYFVSLASKTEAITLKLIVQ